MSIARDNPEAIEPAEFLPKVQDGLLPSHVIPKDARAGHAEQIVERFLAYTDGLTAYVLAKQAEEILKEAVDQLKDRAIVRLAGKSQNVLGADVSTRSLTEYEYHDAELAEWETQIECLKKIIADRKAALRKATVVNGLGEVCDATKTRDGITLLVKFK